MDDTAWKVRRAASRILRKILESGYSFEREVKEKIMMALIQCFGEQEENAKLEINLCLKKYLDSLVHTQQTQEKLVIMKVQSKTVNEFIPKVAKDLIDKILKDLKGNYPDNRISSTLTILPSMAIVNSDSVIKYFEKCGSYHNFLKQYEPDYTVELSSSEEQVIEYISTKFVRALLGILKTTQDLTPDKWKYVPLQDFSDKSDIDWSKSIHEIDLQLYRKYGLSSEEIDFIEANVKEMI